MPAHSPQAPVLQLLQELLQFLTGFSSIPGKIKHAMGHQRLVGTFGDMAADLHLASSQPKFCLCVGVGVAVAVAVAVGVGLGAGAGVGVSVV